MLVLRCRLFFAVSRNVRNALKGGDAPSGSLRVNHSKIGFEWVKRLLGWKGDDMRSDTVRWMLVCAAAAVGLAFAPRSAVAAPGVGDPAAGEAVYLKDCRMCHGLEAAGGFAQRDVRNAGATRTTGAISRRADMNFLAYLTGQQVNDVAAYFATLPAQADDLAARGDVVSGEARYRSSCTHCHTYGKAGQVGSGPDLKGVTTRFSDAYLGAWTGYPKEMIEALAYDPAKLATFRYAMPDLGHSDLEVLDIVSFLFDQDASGANIVETPPVALTPAAFEATKQVYFDRCAGCHGLYRTGATGPDISELRSKVIGTDGLGAILRYGTPAGMPNFGQGGFMTEEQITNVAAYLQLPPPAAPEWTMSQIQASHNLIVPVDQRPTAPVTTRNWQNFTGVILRDAGQVSIIDADTHQEVVRLNTGFAVHILRSSASGRYFYAIGRDGLVTLIDLWPEIPTTVATVKGCIDARSVEGSKAAGWEEQLIIEGCYWPPQYVTFDGFTLEPQNLVDLRTPAGPGGTMTDIYGQSIPENRVAAIAASHTKPLWVVALKESGYVGIVDYSQPGHPMTSKLATEKFLHDGGFDHTGRYFMVAANSSNKMVVIDVDIPAFVTSFTTGSRPHPGRGANWEDPVYGWVNATQHIGEAKISVYGADPVGRPDVAWKVVREIAMPSAGSLFIKTHPNCPWVFFDMTMSSDPVFQKQVCAIDKQTATVQHCFQAATNGLATHIEFNQAGDEIWVSDWAVAGGVVILDAVTLAEKTRIYGPQTPSGEFVTPTGKFNVYNTAHEIY
jgi:nitrite reductase (NO-forming) / hydroxylamine reductase